MWRFLSNFAPRKSDDYMKKYVLFLGLTLLNISVIKAQDYIVP